MLDDASIAGLMAQAPFGAQVSIAFEDGQAHGTAACNSYGGAYHADVMTQERVFLDAMGEVSSFAIEGTQLTLQDRSGAMLLGFDGTAG